MSADTTQSNALSSPGNLLRWAMRFSLSRKVALALTAAATVCGVATYIAMTGTGSPFGPDPKTILVLLNIDLILLLTLGALIAWRLVRVWIERRQGSSGSRLHARMVAMFSLVAVAPAIIVALFSGAFFSFGLEYWFNDRVRTALDRSIAVSEAYLADHRQFIRADVLSMAKELDRIGPRLLEDPKAFDSMLDELAVSRSLSEAIVLRGDGKVLARSKLSFVLEFDPLSHQSLQRAADGEVVIFTSDNSDRVRALSRLDSIVNAFVYVGRFVDSDVLTHMDMLSRAVDDYRRLDSQRSGIQITFTMLYVIVALLLLLAAVWVGLTFANALARPISSLVGAAERVRSGDLSARVVEGPEGDEIASLSRAFNRMTGQLESQRSELIEANRQLDNRRRFTEAVLFGVSAGVMGLDPAGRIFLPNRSALDLLSCSLEDLSGKRLEHAVPEMAPLMAAIRAHGDRFVQDQVSIVRGGRARTLLVRITSERDAGEVQGYVATFDDTTELVNAQRAAAWTDVARRIAHEIKNPLTPIQLSAERLKRKYADDHKVEPDIFTACIDTIVRRVGDIRRMVDEFSTFSRMPAPVRLQQDLSEIVERTVSIQRAARPDLTFAVSLPEDPAQAYCDAAQIEQAVTNLVLNSIAAIDGRDSSGDATLDKGRIDITVDFDPERGHRVQVADNGRGLPQEKLDRLTEPYVTTRARGTGLGLAIVKKIMEDHGGELSLSDRPGGGALVELILPNSNAPNAAESEASSG